MPRYECDSMQACEYLIGKWAPVYAIAGGGKVQQELERKTQQKKPRPAVVWTEELVLRMTTDYQAGISIAQMSRDLDVPPGSIHRKLVAIGVLKVNTSKFKKRYS